MNNARPFISTLAEIKQGRLNDELSDKFQELLAAVQKCGKGGSLILELKVTPANSGGADTVIIEDKVKLKSPELGRGTDLFFLDEQQNLSRKHPRQRDLPNIEPVQRGDKVVAGVNTTTGEVVNG